MSESTETTAETTTETAETTAETTTTASEWDEQRAKATILKQREAEKALRSELAEAKKAQERLAELEAAQLSEQEKAIKRAEEAEAKAAQADQKLRDANLLVALTRADGVSNAKAAARLIEGVQFDDQGEPTNLDERLDAMFTDYPELKASANTTTAAGKAPNVNGGSGAGAAPPPALSPEEAQMAQKLGVSPERYAAMKDVRNVNDFTALNKT